MSDWSSVKLADVADIRVSNVDKKSYPSEKSVRLCNYMDVYSHRQITNSLQFMEATANDAQIAKFKVELGDVLITKDSETPFDIGIPSVVTQSVENLVCGYHLALIKPKFNLVDPVFLSKVLASNKCAIYFSRYAAGSTRYGLSNGAIANISVNLPSLRKQQKIATILTTIDTAIEKTEALIEKHQKIKSGLMHDLFTRGVLPNGQLRPSFEQAPELYQETVLGWIPKEWTCNKLRKVLNESEGYLQTGPFGSQLHSYEYTSEGVPVVMPQDINDGLVGTEYIARIPEERACTLAKHRLQFGDIIIARRGDLTRAAAITAVEQGWVCGTGCFLLRLGRSRLNHFFFAHLYMHDMIQRQIIGTCVGTTMPSLNNYVMGNLYFPCPPLDEQFESTKRIDYLERKLTALISGKAKLSLQKLGLMQDLLTGKVPVTFDQLAEASNGRESHE
jgi:type I restriction enzyme, S subunit